MSRSRCTLHLSQVDQFAAFCAAQGYAMREPLALAHEVLRMVKPGCAPILVHKRLGAKEHVTTWGESDKMLKKWQQSLRAEKEPPK